MIAAFFDMDKTLLHVNSGREWVTYLRKRGEISLYAMLRAIGWLTQYKLSILDTEAVGKKVVGDMAGQSEAELRDKSREFYAEYVAGTIADDGRRAIAHHRGLGHVIVLLTSSTPYVAQPLAADLGIEHVLCTRLGVKDGRFDGTIIEPACYGVGKVVLAERFCKEHDLDLESSYFYTDSFSDLPMLERVGSARVVNPDARLRLFARKVGWETMRW
ncbi:MAG: HAD family hydrolase [Polyangia bacterium]